VAAPVATSSGIAPRFGLANAAGLRLAAKAPAEV
jgi:hypothetical protein